jgi:RNA-directed DNA polymerase
VACAIAAGGERVRGNKGARTAGVDGVTARYIETVGVTEVFLDHVRVAGEDDPEAGRA